MFKVGDLVKRKGCSKVGLIISLGDRKNELIIRWADDHVVEVHKLYIEKVVKN